MTTRDVLLSEMSTLTGVVTDDYEYLLSLILRGNSEHEKEDRVEYEKSKWVPKIDCLNDLGTWFQNMEEVKYV